MLIYIYKGHNTLYTTIYITITIYMCIYMYVHTHIHRELQISLFLDSDQQTCLGLAYAGQSIEKQVLSNIINECLNSIITYKIMWQNVTWLAHQFQCLEFTKWIYLHKDFSIYVKGCLRQHYLQPERKKKALNVQIQNKKETRKIKCIRNS